VHLAGRDRLFERVAIGMRHHEEHAGARILRDDSHQPTAPGEVECADVSSSGSVNVVMMTRLLAAHAEERPRLITDGEVRRHRVRLNGVDSPDQLVKEPPASTIAG
jgi:hypothetical protein